MDMCGLQDKPVLDGTTPLAVLEILAQLRLEVAQLRGEVVPLRVEDLELRQQVGYFKAMHTAATERLETVREELDQVRGENRQLKADLFGRRSQTTSAVDRSNDLDDPHT